MGTEGCEFGRWLGSLRFTYGALQQILLRKNWSMRMAYYPSELSAPHEPGQSISLMHACSMPTFISSEKDILRGQAED